MEKGEGGEIEGKVDWKGRPAIKGKHGGQHISLHVLGIFGFETMASIALAVNLVTYMNGVMHFVIADAANAVTNFTGTGYILSIAVAFFADTYIGRYKAIIFAACVECMGFALLTIQAHVSKFKPPPCNIFDPTSKCEKVNGSNAGLLFTSLYLIALGSAGIKAALPSHGADQFEEKDPQEAKQMSSFFNWLLLSVCLGGSISLIFIVWIQTNKGWDWGFGVSMIAMFLGIIIFIAGIPRYRIHVNKGANAITEIIQVYVAAIRNRKLQLPENPEELYEIHRVKEADMEIEFLPHRDIFREYHVHLFQGATNQDVSTHTIQVGASEQWNQTEGMASLLHVRCYSSITKKWAFRGK